MPAGAFIMMLPLTYWSWLLQVNLRDRVEELRTAVQATEQNRQAAMKALSEERQRSLELQVKISRQVLCLFPAVKHVIHTFYDWGTYVQSSKSESFES